VVTSYPGVVWQPNCAEARSIHIPPELPLFPQRVLVALETDQQVEYVTASGWDRVYLLWMFRNFRRLPQNVLSPRQKQLIGSLYREAANRHSDELHGAAVVGTVEDFRPSSPATLPSFAKIRKRVAREESLPDVPTLGSKPFYARLTFNRITLKVASAALMLMIAILAWHQLGAQPVAGSSSTQTAVAARRTDEPMLTGSITKEPPQKDLAPASVEPAANLAVTAPLTDTGSNPEGIAAVGTAAPGVRRSAAPAPGVPTSITPPRVHTLTALSQPNEAPASLHHPAATSPKTYEAAADQPRMQISGRPRKLVYPVCPETQARGKVSLQAVVGYDGAVSRVRVLTGNRALAAAAVEAVRQWRYEPFSGTAPRQERETNITISFISDEVVAVSFPSSALLSR
jgi:TonB family protein